MKKNLIVNLSKLKILLFLILLSHCSKAQFWPEYNFNETGMDHIFSCTSTKKCVKLHDCPELLDLMQQQALPVSR